MTTYNNLIKNLEELKLNKVINILPSYLDEVASKPPHLVDMLNHLTNEELKERTIHVSEALIRTAGFPFRRTITEY
ncbi:MAG: hypothetical protein LBI12_08440, partial [Treponema sp.]|nr:hypothetical protein [Treponema sp.]